MPSVVRTSGQPGIELGVHGDDRVELKLEVMDRPEHSGLRSLGQKHQKQRREVIRIEFKRFVEKFVRLPANPT